MPPDSPDELLRSAVDPTIAVDPKEVGRAVEAVFPEALGVWIYGSFADGWARQDSDLDIAVVIDAGHRLPDERLWLELADVDGVHAQRVGDCVAPRTVYDAILEGRRAALALG